MGSDPGAVPTDGWLFFKQNEWRENLMEVRVEETSRKLCEYELPDTEGAHCEVKFGPPKNLARCLDKAKEPDRQKPGELKGIGALRDLNRASIVAEHPIDMAVSYHVFKLVAEAKGAKIDSVKISF